MRLGDIFVAAFALVVVVSGFELTEKRENFSCCPTPKVKFNCHCDHVWRINNMNFAWLKKDSDKYECKSPCKRIEGGLMELDRCTDVVNHMTCGNEEVTEEVNLHLQSVSCSSSATNLEGMLLFAVLAAIMLWTI